jgi:hypothetical protein
MTRGAAWSAVGEHPSQSRFTAKSCQRLPAVVGPDNLNRVQFGCICGKSVDAEPWSGGNESTHGGGDVSVQDVPHEHDRAVELLMGGVEQGGEVRFAEAFFSPGRRCGTQSGCAWCRV